MKDFYKRLNINSYSDINTDINNEIIKLPDDEKTAIIHMLLHDGRKKVYDKTHRTLKQIGILRDLFGNAIGDEFWGPEYDDFNIPVRKYANIIKKKVIIQKSIREGFGLTITEALWKGKPVVASNVGVIPLQIENGKSGYLLEPSDTDGFVEKILQLLQNTDLSQEMGKMGKEMVRNKFLITRLISDYIDLLNEIL